MINQPRNEVVLHTCGHVVLYTMPAAPAAVLNDRLQALRHMPCMNCQAHGCHSGATTVAPATTVATPVASPATRRRRGPATIPATDAWNTATAVAAPVTRPCHASRTCAPRPRRLSTTDEVRLMAAICFAALVGAAMLALLEGALG